MATNPLKRIQECLQSLKTFIGRRSDQPYQQLNKRINTLLAEGDSLDQPSLQAFLSYISTLSSDSSTEKKLSNKLRLVLIILQDQIGSLFQREGKEREITTKNSEDSPHTYFTPSPQEGERILAEQVQVGSGGNQTTVPILTSDPSATTLDHEELSKKTEPTRPSPGNPRPRRPSGGTPQTRKGRK